MKRIAIYARVSTDKQSTKNQLLELRIVCTKLSYTIVQEYIDNGISGTKSRGERPALNDLLKDATRRKFAKMNGEMRFAVKLLREKGMGIKYIARELQIGVGTVYSVI